MLRPYIIIRLQYTHLCIFKVKIHSTIAALHDDYHPVQQMELEFLQLAVLLPRSHS